MDTAQTAHPTAPHRSAGRLTAAVIAGLSGFAVLIQPTLGEWSYIGNFGGMMRFFTMWGNVAACVIMAAIAFGKDVPRSVMAALATALTIIGGIYWGLLSGMHHPVGLDRVTNQFHHTIVPILTILWWLRFTPPADSIKALLPVIMIPPLTYGAFAFVLGELTGFYAYFFVDLPKLGWTQFLINNAGLALFFAAVGAGLVWVKDRLGWYREG